MKILGEIKIKEKNNNNFLIMKILRLKMINLDVIL